MIKSGTLLLLSVLFLTGARTLTETEFQALAAKCAPQVAYDTLRALVRTESSFNPLAIAVVGGKVRQPSSLPEALTTVMKLQRGRESYSLGLGQINSTNFRALGLEPAELFDPCVNLSAAAKILTECYERTQESRVQGERLTDALSCYYSGNERTGYEHGYVQRVLHNAGLTVPSLTETLTRPEAPSLQGAEQGAGQGSVKPLSLIHI